MTGDGTAPPLTKAEISLAYRLFLDRLPSGVEVERMQAAHKSIESLRKVFLTSAEFAARHAPPSPQGGAAAGARMPQAALAPRKAPKTLAPDLKPCDAERVVFLHVPKCGGTTLHHILEQWFGRANMHPERFNELYSYTGAQLASALVYSGHYDFYATTLIPGPKKLVSFLRDPVERLVSLYNFHRAHTPEAIERGNLLLPRWASEHDIDAYFAHPEIRRHPAIDNTIVRVFSSIPQTSPSMIGAELRNPTLEQMLEQALANLEKFTFVGFMDSYGRDVARLADTLGCAAPAEFPKHQVLDRLMDSGGNVRRIEKQRPSRQTRDSLEELTRYDRLFYARARALFA